MYLIYRTSGLIQTNDMNDVIKQNNLFFEWTSLLSVSEMNNDQTRFRLSMWW